MKQSRRSRRVTALAGVIVTGVFAAHAQGAVLAKSGFDNDAEGWKVIGDTGSGTENATHFESGGKPGGYISIDDAATGGVMYWRAPQTYRKKAKNAYKGSLAFSLRQSANGNQFDTSDIVIEGGGLTLVYDTSPNPSLPPTWTTYKVPLTKAGWSDQTGSPEPATGSDMKTALASVDSLVIRAEYETGPDTDDLDSVKLKTAPKN